MIVEMKRVALDRLRTSSAQTSALSNALHLPNHRHPMPHQSKDPLHGVTLERIVTELSAHFGWAELADRIEIRCFRHDPSVKSSLVFLRKTPWARTKVEELYVRWKSGDSL